MYGQPSFADTQLTPNQDFETWCERMWRHCSPWTVVPSNPRGFKAALQTWDFGDFGVRRFSAPAFAGEQSRDQVYRARLRRLIFRIPSSGAFRLNQFGREVSVEPGQAVFSVTTAPLTYSQDEVVSGWLFCIPLEHAKRYVDDPEDLCAQVISDSAPGYKLAREYLLKFSDVATAMSPIAASCFIDAAVESICGVLQELRSRDPLPRSTVVSRRLREIKVHVRHNFDEPDLSADSIAKANGISVRYLHHLFHLEGTTVSKWIRKERIKKCHEAITNPLFANISISELAGRFGFSSSSQFRKAFKAEYGVSASACRAAALSASTVERSAGAHFAARKSRSVH